MGKFFNTLHVKTVKRETFIECFEWIMKKEGFVPCADNDEAEVLFAAAFSEGGWVSLSYNEESADGLHKLSERLAKDLLSPNFTVEAVDSDFAILEICVPDKKTKLRKSRLVVGDGEGYGVEKSPVILDDWRRFFQNGGVDEFLAAAGQDCVFVEDALCELGKIFGIKPAVMAWCYEEFEERIGSGDVISLAFKKKAGKKLTLNAAFKQVFGEALEPLGFKLIKGRYPYFVRVVHGGEIIHVITYIDKATGIKTQKSFDIVGGAATVYRKDLNLSESPKDNVGWLNTLRQFNGMLNSDNSSFAVKKFEYSEADETFMCSEVERSLELTKQILLPILNGTIDIESCIKYFYQFNSPLMNLAEDEFENNNPNRFCYEGLLLVKTKDWGIGEEHIKYSLAEAKTIINDPKLSKLAFDELERRKQENTEKLRGYGLDI